jgi:hypothetical protein
MEPDQCGDRLGVERPVGDCGRGSIARVEHTVGQLEGPAARGTPEVAGTNGAALHGAG